MFYRNTKLEQQIGEVFQKFVAGEITIKEFVFESYEVKDGIYDVINEDEETSDLLLKDALYVLEDVKDRDIQEKYQNDPELLYEMAQQLLGLTEAKYRFSPEKDVVVEITYRPWRYKKE